MSERERQERRDTDRENQVPVCAHYSVLGRAVAVQCTRLRRNGYTREGGGGGERERERERESESERERVRIHAATRRLTPVPAAPISVPMQAVHIRVYAAQRPYTPPGLGDTHAYTEPTRIHAYMPATLDLIQARLP